MEILENLNYKYLSVLISRAVARFLWGNRNLLIKTFFLQDFKIERNCNANF